MFRKELFVLSLMAAVIFVLVAGVSAWMTRTLAHDARMLVEDTLPGLVNSGEAIRLMDGNWEKLLGLTALPSAAARSNVISQIQSRTTTEYWDRYQASIFDARDQQLFSTLLAARQNSRALGEQFFQLVNEQQLAEAQQFLMDRLTPAFNDYRNQAGKLFELNTEIGNQRSQRMTQLARWLPAVAGSFSVIVFGLGFLFGLRGAFTGLEFVFKRSGRR